MKLLLLFLLSAISCLITFYLTKNYYAKRVIQPAEVNYSNGVVYTDMMQLGNNNTGMSAHHLDQHQIQFIDECKKAGRRGCIITVMGQQTYISFYENKSK